MPTSMKWLIVFALVVVTIVVPALLIPESVLTLEHITTDSRPGPVVFSAISLMLALDIVLPVPSSILSTAAGATLGSLWGTLASWLGMTIGCVAGYGIGVAANRSLLNRFMSRREIQQAERLSMRYGLYFVLLARPVPVLAELCVFYAGATRLKFVPFLLLVSLSNLLLAGLYGVVGDYTINSGSFLLACLVMFSIPGLGLLLASRLASPPVLLDMGPRDH